MKVHDTNRPYLWLQIAMYNTVMSHQRERGEHLGGETANQCRGKSDKPVGLDELVEVVAEEFHGNAQMIAEVEVLCHLDDMVFLVGIL